MTRFHRALTLRASDKSRNRAFDLVALARVHLLTGDLEQAAETVNRALPLLDTHRPGRLARTLNDWQRESMRVESVPAVRDSRTAIIDVLTAHAV